MFSHPLLNQNHKRQNSAPGAWRIIDSYSAVFIAYKKVLQSSKEPSNETHPQPVQFNSYHYKLLPPGLFLTLSSPPCPYHPSCLFHWGFLNLCYLSCTSFPSWFYCPKNIRQTVKCYHDKPAWWGTTAFSPVNHHNYM